MDTPSIHRAHVQQTLHGFQVGGAPTPEAGVRDSPVRIAMDSHLSRGAAGRELAENVGMLTPELTERIASHETSLARRQTGASWRVAKETAEILRAVVGQLRFRSGSALIDALKYFGCRMIAAQPLEFEVGNIVRRVLFIAREEVNNIHSKKKKKKNKGNNRDSDGDDDDEGSSSGEDERASEAEVELGFSNAASPRPQPNASPAPSPAVGNSVNRGFADGRPNLSRSRSSLAVSRSMAIDGASVIEEETTALERQLSEARAVKLKREVIASIAELTSELSHIFRNVAEQGPEHIHANEVIMTFGASRTVTEFLKTAKRKGRNFTVIVAESAPSLRGRDTAATLAASGVPCTLIPDAAVFAVMSRVNKVIVGTHGVMANGGLVALTGTHAVALAAKHHEVPFVCVCGLYKLTPLYPHDTDSYNDVLSPAAILPFEEADALQHVHVKNPAFDFVPPELVTLYITNYGGHSPSYIYRLLSEYYSPEDEDVSQAR